MGADGVAFANHMTAALPFLLCLAVLALLISVTRRKLYGPVGQPAPEPKPTEKPRPVPAATLPEIEATPYDELKRGDLVVCYVGQFVSAPTCIVDEGRSGNGDKFFVTRGTGVPESRFAMLDRTTYAGRVKQ